jgi:hypothetical protein
MLWDPLCNRLCIGSHGIHHSDWDGDNTYHKSTSGYVLSLGFGPIYWSRKKKSTISLSSVEVEYKGVVNITI